MKKPKVCVLRTAGTNCDEESAFAFSKAGAWAELVHINRLLAGKKHLQDYHILVIPGGFSYGDDIAAGKILANELRYKLIEDIRRFIREGKLIVGICNGFQVLLKSGLLPGNNDLTQEASLIINDSGKFEDRWVYLKKPETRAQKPEKCIWVKNLPEIVYLPVAHGEGKFITKDKSVLERLTRNGQVVFQYCDGKGKLADYPCNPNGSVDNIAGVCDETGRILGLMPHPERHLEVSQHPRWEKLKYRGDGSGDHGLASDKPEGNGLASFGQSHSQSHGLAIFRNGVEYARRNL